MLAPLLVVTPTISLILALALRFVFFDEVVDMVGVLVVDLDDGGVGVLLTCWRFSSTVVVAAAIFLALVFASRPGDGDDVVLGATVRWDIALIMSLTVVT